MINKALAKRIPLPSKDSINTGLHSPHNASVIRYLGDPRGKKSSEMIVTLDVGPFKATGNKHFLFLLRHIFEKVKVKRPDLYESVKSAGCFAIRPQRGTKTVKSNHSWGIAIDLFFGDAVTPRGSNQTEQGLMDLYPFFHEQKLYSGAEFPVDDAMHIEASLELLQQWSWEGFI